MIRIGEAAKQFNISNRTLRYWEDEGILYSQRKENGYRYFDDENLRRIQQIVLLRRLRMQISDIEKLFKTDEPSQAVAILHQHLQDLLAERANLGAIALLVEQLSVKIRTEDNWQVALAALEPLAIDGDIGNTEALQMMLSGRKSNMNIKNERIRLVRIPPMMVAAYCATSATPENDCSAVMDKFITEYELEKTTGFRHFGFNNPSPTEGNPVYGYEIWITIPKGLKPPAPIVKKQTDGGLYASISTHLNEIGERWGELWRWLKENEEYEYDADSQWLEECVDYETFMQSSADVQQLDLLIPIKKKI